MPYSMKVCLTMSALICPPKAVATATRQSWFILAVMVNPVRSTGCRGLNSYNHSTHPGARR